jgi:hypothetical protein
MKFINAALSLLFATSANAVSTEKGRSDYGYGEVGELVFMVVVSFLYWESVLMAKALLPTLNS